MSFSLLAAARDRPAADALITDGRTWSYRALAEAVRAAMTAVTSALAARGWRPEELGGATQGLLPEGVPRLALVARPDPEAIAALLALVELGLPALLLHPAASEGERARQAAEAGAALLLDGPLPPGAPTALPASAALLLDGPLPPAAPTAPPAGATPLLDGPLPPGAPTAPSAGAAPLLDGPLPPGAPTALPAATASPIPAERCLALLFTSGTSGAPKAVVLARAAFAFAATASHANLPLSVGDRWLLALPFAHVGGLSVILRCVRARAAVVLAPPRAAGADRAAELAETLARHRVTIASLVPTQLHRLLERSPPLAPPPSLRAVLLGGSAASPALLSRADDRGWPVLTTYGLTETCAQVATERPGAPRPTARGAGPPLPGVEVRITAAGAIAVRSPALLGGYLAGGALRPPPLDADGFLITGDAGHLDPEGHLHVLGRLDEVIVTGGEKVHPLEVEAALLAAPGVGAACVFPVADAEWGQRVAVALCPSPAGAPGAPGAIGNPRPGTGAVDDDALLAAVVRALAPLARWKRPRSYALVEALPLTASGKPDRRAAAAAFAARLRPLPPG